MNLFNCGVVVVTPNAGNLAPNPTPLVLNVLQDMQWDVSQEQKELYGQNIFPVDVASGKGKISGKGKFASFTGKLLTDMVTGQAATTGYSAPVYLEGPTAIPATPFQITVAHGANFVADLGVINSATGAVMIAVPSGTPTAGQYKVAAGGVYTFSSADNVSAISVKISYLYSVSGSGYSVVVANQLMGFGPIFSIDHFVNYEGNVALLRFKAARMTKWSFPAKQGEHLIQDVEFQCFADAAGNVWEIDANI